MKGWRVAELQALPTLLVDKLDKLLNRVSLRPDLWSWLW